MGGNTPDAMTKDDYVLLTYRNTNEETIGEVCEGEADKKNPVSSFRCESICKQNLTSLLSTLTGITTV